MTRLATSSVNRLMTRVANRSSSDPERGSAMVEFISVGVLLLVPLVYFVITMARIQAATFAADGSAREAARAFVTARDDEDGHRRAEIAVRLGLRDQGFTDLDDADLSVACAGRVCLTPGSRVVVQVQVRVILPGVPRFLDRVVPTRVTVRSTQTAAVDRFRRFRTDRGSVGPQTTTSTDDE